MTPWLVVLAIEAVGIVAVILFVRRVLHRTTDTLASWHSLTDELRPALVELRRDTDHTRARIEALRGRSGGTGQH